MSYKYGMAAINLEMTDKVPRTEYSAHFHWELINRMFNLNITPDSPQEEKDRASARFLKEWDYGMFWNIAIGSGYLGDYYTDMGHAAYATNGSDFHEAGKPVFEDEDEVIAFDPMEKLPYYTEEEMIGIFNDNYRKMNETFDDTVNMTGTYITCVSGMIDMLGWDTLLMTAGIYPEEFGQLVNRYTDWMLRWYKALAQSDSPVVMVHDDIVWTDGAFLHPDWYRKYVFPNFRKLFAPLHEAGKKILYTADGTYDEFIDDIADCGINGFVMEPTTDMEYIAEKYGKTHAFVGNADTRVLLEGDKDDIYAEVKRCMDIGKKYPGFIMAVGNHIPSNTPYDSCMWYNEAYEKMSRR